MRVDFDTMMVEYAKRLNAKLKSPNYYSMEQRKKGREFLDAWKLWSIETKKYLKFLRQPVWLAVLYFPIFVAYSFYIQRKCDKIYKDLEEKQDAFQNSLRTMEAKDG